VDAGAAEYIEKGLTGGLGGGLSAFAPFYDASLTAVDNYAKTKFGTGFGSLAPNAQDAVLGDVQADKAGTGFLPSPATWFALLLEHTRQGMFCDPVYGGNKSFIGWDLIGYYGVKSPATAADQRLDVVLAPVHKSTYADGQFPKARKEAQA
jgi:gluconate 2-dehydrogenase gamma chain